jgi:hypothetical protein
LRKSGQDLAKLSYLALAAQIRDGSFYYQHMEGVQKQPPQPAYQNLIPFKHETNAAPLNLPLGQIAYSETEALLPRVGILVRDVGASELARPLLALLSEHHRSPFGKILFLLESLELAPFLGRYGFAIHHTAKAEISTFSARWSAEYGIGEIRCLLSGEALG